MYHININVGNFALGKLKQRIEFSSKGFRIAKPWCRVYVIHN